jgi:hypothetical protein
VKSVDSRAPSSRKRLDVIEVRIEQTGLTIVQETLNIVTGVCFAVHLALRPVACLHK